MAKELSGATLGFAALGVCNPCCTPLNDQKAGTQRQKRLAIRIAGEEHQSERSWLQVRGFMVGARGVASGHVTSVWSLGLGAVDSRQHPGLGQR